MIYRTIHALGLNIVAASKLLFSSLISVLPPNHLRFGCYIMSELLVIQMNIQESVCKQIAQELKINQSSQCLNTELCYQFFYDNGAISIISKYMDGGSLADFLKIVKNIPRPYLAAIFNQVLEGLWYHHNLEKHTNSGEMKLTNSGVSAILASTSVIRMARRTLPTLPIEIIVEEILMQLPVKLVIRTRSVCKLWNSRFSQPGFIRSQLNYGISQNLTDDYLIFNTLKFNGRRKLPDGISILSRSNLSEICINNVPYPLLDHDRTQLVGSINGLVCILYISRVDSVFDSYHFILWNPALNLSKKILLPEDHPSRFMRGNRFLFGFALDSVANNYKIIIQAKDLVQAVVYSCKTDSWINIADSKFSEHIIETERCWLPSVIVKGICYWDCFGTSSQVLKFDPRNNEFTYLRVPCVRRSNKKLVNLNDCLARVEYAHVGEDIMDVYFFNEECSIWSKIYTTNIGISDNRFIISCFKSGGMMIVFHSDHRKYSFCDPKSNEIKSISCCYDRMYFKYFGKGVSYTPSLVSLDEMKSLHP